MTNINKGTILSTNKVNQLVKYIPYILIISIIIFIIIVTILFSQNIQESKSLRNMEEIYKDNSLKRTNHCSDNLIKYRVCDYYIASSFQSCSVKSKKFGYVSTKILKKVIVAGARYIEIDIFNKEQLADTTPVVSSGSASGDFKYTLNTIDLVDVLKTISDTAFSPNYISNYTDPLFLFLNIKIKNNVNTINKIYDIIKKTLGHKLLGSEYCFQQRNIALEPICNLIEWKADTTVPKFIYRSNKISIEPGSDGTVITIDDVDLIEMGVRQNYSITISGTDVSRNDKPIPVLINSLSKTELFLDSNIKFIEENPGNRITLRFFTNKRVATSGKIVIMSNDNFKDSKLNELINCSLLNNYMKKDTEFELNTVTKAFSGKSVLPTETYTSNKISFQTGLGNDIISIKDVNLSDFNIKKNYTVKISGAKYGKNNHDVPILISSLTKNKIVVEPSTSFISELDGNEITLDFFSDTLSQKYNKLNGDNITNFTKSNINIVTPNDIISAANYDSYNFFSRGIQFISMNYQTNDHNMQYYMKKFKYTSFVVKPSNLRIDRPIPKNNSLKSKIPKILDVLKVDIDYSFFSKFMNQEDDTFGQIYISPFSYNNMRLINNKGKAHISIKYDTGNSVFKIRSPGLNGKPDSISISIADSYLIHKDYCCYLTFADLVPLSDKHRSKFNDNASFYPVRSSCGKKGYYSFISTKDELYMKRNGNRYTGPNYKLNYIIKYRTNFNMSQRLYTKTTKYFNKIHTFVSQKGSIKIWRADPLEGFYPLGDMATFDNPTSNPTVPDFITYLVNGATEKPIDYELVWDNKGSYTGSRCSIWKPIPPDGYMSLGYIVNKSFKMPSVDLVRCVAVDFIDEIKIGDKYGFRELGSTMITDQKTGAKRQIGWENVGISDKDPLSFWKVPNNANLMLATSSYYKPSEFDTPVYNLISEDIEIDYKDRLYMEKLSNTADSRLSGCFKINKLHLDEISPGIINAIKKSFSKTNEIKKMGLEKIRTNNVYENKCINVDSALWSEPITSKKKDVIFDVTGMNNDEVDGTLKADVIVDKCDKPEYRGTNWIMYPDKSIRLGYNTNYCLSVQSDEYGPITSKHGMTPEEIQVFRTSIHGGGSCVDGVPSYNSNMLPDNLSNVVKVTKCQPGLKNQKFKFINEIKEDNFNNGMLKYDGDNALFQDTCITHTDNFQSNLRLENCEDVYSQDKQKLSRQKWNKLGSGPIGCLSIGTYVYVKQLVPRDSNRSIFQTDIIGIEDDTLDENSFHIYVAGQIVGETNNDWKVKLEHNKQTKVISKSYGELGNEINIVVNKIPSVKDIKDGDNVLCSNGIITTYNASEEYIKWKGVIIKKVSDSKYMVVFSINSIEPDKIRETYSRPRQMDVKNIRISDICILKKFPECLT